MKNYKMVPLSNRTDLVLMGCTTFLAVAGVLNLIIQCTAGVIVSRYITAQVVFLIAGITACFYIQHTDFQYERLFEKKWLPGLMMGAILILIFLRHLFPWVNGTYYWLGTELIHISIGLVVFALYGIGTYALLIQKREQLWKYIFFLLIPVAFVLHRYINDVFYVTVIFLFTAFVLFWIGDFNNTVFGLLVLLKMTLYERFNFRIWSSGDADYVKQYWNHIYDSTAAGNDQLKKVFTLGDNPILISVSINHIYGITVICVAVVICVVVLVKSISFWRRGNLLSVSACILLFVSFAIKIIYVFTGYPNIACATPIMSYGTLDHVVVFCMIELILREPFNISTQIEK